MRPDTSTSPVSADATGNPCRWNHWHHHHFHRCHHHPMHGIIMGLTVIALGGLLLAREYGLISSHLHVFDFWPLLLVGFGLSRVVPPRSGGSVLFGLVVALIGAGLLAERLGLVAFGATHLWPLLLVAAGVGIIWKGFAHRTPRPHEDQVVSEGMLQRSVTMGSLKVLADSQQFKGAILNATMGGVEVDLRRVTMASDESTIELALVMSAVELYVPAHWQVVNEISPFMGAVEDQTTLTPDSAGVQKRLVLRGTITMGAVMIRN